MEPTGETGKCNQKFFVIAPYHANGEGEFIAEIPTMGPCHKWDDQPCHIEFHHLRARKTGPCIPLYILYCNVHDKAFTIYPPGFLPYGRKRMAPVAPDNSPISVPSDMHPFEGTYFDAALDASKQSAWPRETINSQSLFPTQVNHLKRGGMITGVEPDLPESIRERISLILDVPALLIRDGRSAIADGAAPKYQRRGEAIRHVLDCLPDTLSLFDSIARAAACAGLCPEPDIWDERRKMFKSSPYHRFAARASP